VGVHHIRLKSPRGTNRSRREVCVPQLAATPAIEHGALDDMSARDERSFEPAQRRPRSGERLILVSDGIVARRTEDGGRFGVDGIRRAVEEVADNPTAAATAMAILQAVTDCWREPLEDDGTVVVLCVA
jgi:hypothetical protein